MESSAYIAISQQSALRQQMDIIANNIANISTPGFKSGHLSFKEYVNRNVNNIETSFVQELGMVSDLSQGPLNHTGAELDFAINGEGFFSVGALNGTKYTRNGHFKMDGNGQVVNENGDPLLSDSGGPIVLPSAANEIRVTKDGTIYADKSVVGKIGLVKFERPELLERESGGLYKLPANSADAATPVESPEIVQASLETSNVQGVVEITKMMQVSRSYETAQKLVEREDDRVRQAIRRLGQMQ